MDKWRSVEPLVPVADHILHLLGDVDDVRATACKFFEHIHSWMPFISKKRFYDLYLPSPFRIPIRCCPSFAFAEAHHNATSHESAKSSDLAVLCREALPPSSRRLECLFSTSPAGCGTLGSL